MVLVSKQKEFPSEHLGPAQQSKPVWPHPSWPFDLCSKSSMALSSGPTSDAETRSSLANPGSPAHQGA